MTESNITIKFHNLPERVQEHLTLFAKTSGCSLESIMKDMIVSQAEEMAEDFSLFHESMKRPGEFVSHEEARRILLKDE
ncbi:MAG: hypothetical protein HY053_01285 [Proteobacteria bacterium]|nr:hypothetical protein [Pseudomonadota bacterium]